MALRFIISLFAGLLLWLFALLIIESSLGNFETNTAHELLAVWLPRILVPFLLYSAVLYQIRDAQTWFSTAAFPLLSLPFLLLSVAVSDTLLSDTPSSGSLILTSLYLASLTFRYFLIIFPALMISSYLQAKIMKLPLQNKTLHPTAHRG